MTQRFVLATSLILAVMGFRSSTAFAQGFPKHTATIPFNFVAEGTSLPAGTYAVEMNSGMLLLLNTKQAAAEGEAATLPLPLKDTASRPELIFVNSNAGYTLVEIRTERERRLLTSEYGHPQFSEQQLRRVPMTSELDQSSPSAKQASSRSTDRH